MTLRLVALTDLERFPTPTSALRSLCEQAKAGSVAVVLRDRGVPLDVRLALGRSLREVTAETGQLLLVSDRVDLALELWADGVHLPARGLLPTEVEALFPGALVSRSHHDVEHLTQVELERCKVLLVSPAFAERKGRPPLGPAGLGERIATLRERAPKASLLALGGVDGRSVARALAAGADGIAAIGAAHDLAEQRALIVALGIARAEQGADQAAARKST